MSASPGGRADTTACAGRLEAQTAGLQAARGYRLPGGLGTRPIQVAIAPSTVC
jgi:hypothetical protein